MSDPNSILISGFWSSCCRRAESHAQLMAGQCQDDFGELITKEAKRFLDQSPPADQAQLDEKLAQATALSGKIFAIAHADTMAKLTPLVAHEIYESTKRFCDTAPLDRSLIEVSFAFSAEVRELSSSNLVKRGNRA